MGFASTKQTIYHLKRVQLDISGNKLVFLHQQFSVFDGELIEPAVDCRKVRFRHTSFQRLLQGICEKTNTFNWRVNILLQPTIQYYSLISPLSHHTPGVFFSLFYETLRVIIFNAIASTTLNIYASPLLFLTSTPSRNHLLNSATLTVWPWFTF